VAFRGFKPVTSDAHAGLINAIGATLPGASWQRCRTHYAANLMAVTPKSSWPWVRTSLYSVFDQPDAESVGAQYDRIIDALADKQLVSLRERIHHQHRLIIEELETPEARAEMRILISRSHSSVARLISATPARRSPAVGVPWENRAVSKDPKL
jgi:transposase-like protein